MSLLSVRTVACSLLEANHYLEMGVLSKDLWDEEPSCYFERDGGNKSQFAALQLQRLHLMITLLFVHTNRESLQAWSLSSWITRSLSE